MAFTPDDIAGGVLWLKADAISGVDADPVATWEDSFASNNDATQATSASRPTLRTNVVNSLPVVRFDGTDDHLTLPNLMSGATAGTGFVVSKNDADPAASAVTSGPPLGDWGTDAQADHWPYTDGVIYSDWGTNSRRTAGNPTPSLAAWNIASLRSASADLKYYINGTQLYTSATNTPTWGTAPLIGRSAGGGGPYRFDGDIAEIVVYPEALSTLNRQRVEGYLAHKYGIAAVLPVDHPYKSSAPGFEGGELEEDDHTLTSATLSWTSSVGGTGTVTEQLQRSPSGAGTWSNVFGGTSSPVTDTGLTANTAYDYRVAYTDDVTTVYSNTVTVTTSGLVEFYPTTIIGTTGSLGGDPTRTRTAAFDGDFYTFFEAPNATGDWVGIDLGVGNAGVLTKIRYAAAVGTSGTEGRIQGAKFQASNDPTFASGVVDLYTVPSNPAAVGRQLTEVNIDTGGTAYRCFRALSKTAGYVSFAELRFIGEVGSGADERPVPPTISPWGGGFPASSRVVTLESLTSTASIYYTTDGTTPDNTDTLYDGPFTLAMSGATTLKAIAYDSAMAQPTSEVSAATFRPYQYGPDEWWDDQLGHRVQAMGGNITWHDERYWWVGFGNNRYTVSTDITDHYAVNLYSSNDLRNWREEGPQILGMPQTGARIYRVSIIYNALNDNWVLWGNNVQSGGSFAQHAHVATTSGSDIRGPWSWVTTGYGISPFNEEYQDNSLFLDDDGKGYVIINVDGEWITIAELDANFTNVTANRITIDSGATFREAPSLIKRNGNYFLVTSHANYYDITNTFDPGYLVGTGGTTPLNATWGTAPYTDLFASDPVGTVYNNQPNVQFKVPGKSNGFLYRGDRWYLRSTVPGSQGLYDTTQVWLPFSFPTATTASVSTPASWNLSTLTDLFTPPVLTLDSVTATSATLSWTNASGGTAPYTYDLQRAPNVYDEFTSTGATASPATRTGLTEGVAYEYRVKATDDAGNVVYSNWVTAVPEASAASEGTLSVTLADATASGTGVGPITGTLSATLDAATLSATSSSGVTGSLSVTLDNATASGTGTGPIAGALTATLGAATLSATGGAASTISVEVQGGAAITSGSTDTFSIPLEGVGETYDRTYSVTNDTAGTLSITISLSGDGNLQGSGTLLLDADVTGTVTVRYPSDTAGALASTVTLNYGATPFSWDVAATVLAVQTEFDTEEVWNGGRREIVWRITPMGRPGQDSNDAQNVLEAFTFSDRTRFVDMTRRLGNATLASVSHDKTERWTVTDDVGAWTEVADGPAVDAEEVNSAAVTVYHGTDEVGTIAIGKGFSFDAANGEAGTTRFTFSYVDSNGEADGVRVVLKVEE